MEKIAKDSHIPKQSHRFFRSNLPVSKESVNDCRICIKAFENDQEKNLDQCQNSGKILGWAHSQKNGTRKSINFTPVIAHNMADYDIHHKCTIINKSNSNNKFCVSPTTEEQ